ncbi:MAG: VOC family protein [Actinomycetota bacterium]
MGAVTLRVKDLDSMLRYYRDALGLDVVADLGSSIILGRGSEPALIVEHSPELKYAGSHEAGLFHTAFIFDTKEQLANAVSSLARAYPTSFTGSADHLVSEAFYFDDPEGNGVELYFDRERTSWSWQHGQVQMDTLWLDPNKYLNENATESKLVASKVGHVHLSVGNIPQAEDFYVNKLGFDVTMNFAGTALFVSAGGYHHHMAMNIWRSRGAGPRQQTLGLGDVEIELPDSDSLGAISERLSHFGLQLRNDGQKVKVDDPWGNQVSLTLQ